MKAITFDQFGSSSVLKISEAPTPSPGAGEVLVKITHTSVNPVDWKIREGHLQSLVPHRLPIIPGWDAAGEIAELGAGVASFAKGDLVYAYTRLPEVHSGTYAEYIALPATYVAKKPENLSLEIAAGVPLVALTARQALEEVVHITKGDKVLITGGAGGVGSFAIQFAKLAGAEVTSTSSAANVAYLKELGADHALDYTRGALAPEARAIAPQGFDVIFDAVGGDSLKEALALAAPKARIVSIVESPEGGQFHFVYPNGAQLADITKLFENGKLLAPAVTVRSIKEAAEAQDLNAKRRGRGKTVLRIDF